MLSSQEKIELLSNKIIFLESVLASEILDLAELKKVNHTKVTLVEADIVDRKASITALRQELATIEKLV
jgi:hypothetical protein